MLAASGVLDERMGGPGFSPFKPNTNYVRVYRPKDNSARPNGGGWSTCPRCGWSRTPSSARSIAPTPA